MASVTDEEYTLLHVVLADAVDNAHSIYTEYQRIYNENYRPYRLDAARLDWETAKRALELVESWRAK